MTNEVTVITEKKNEIRWFIPSSESQAMALSEMLARSTLVPSHFKGKPSDVYIAIAMGASIGLGWMQSVQNIQVIHSKPSIYGDAVNAIVTAHREFYSHEFIWDEAKVEWKITIVRIRNGVLIPVTITYGKKDAETAGHLTKDTYKKNLKDMLRRRCYGKVAQIQFPDALGGFSFAEEEEDFAYTQKKTKINEMNTVENSIAETMGIKPADVIEGEVLEDIPTQSSAEPAKTPNSEPQKEPDTIPPDESRKLDQVTYLEELLSKYSAATFAGKIDIRESWCKSAGVDKVSDMKPDRLSAFTRMVEIILEKNGVA